jgi:hypothetical protein
VLIALTLFSAELSLLCEEVSSDRKDETDEKGPKDGGRAFVVVLYVVFVLSVLVADA